MQPALFTAPSPCIQTGQGVTHFEVRKQVKEIIAEVQVWDGALLLMQNRHHRLPRSEA